MLSMRLRLVFLGRLLVTSFCVLAVAETGCFWTTKHEGNKLRKDVGRIDGDLGKVQLNVKGKVEELQKVLDQATKLLTRNSANIGAEVDTLERENAEMRGLVMAAKRLADQVASQIKEQRERLDSFEKRITDLEAKLAEGPQKSADDMFDEAKRVFNARNYERATDMFRAIVVKHSTHSIAPEAQYFRAESLYKMRNYKSAIGEFQKVFDKYPRSKRADEALYRAGESAEALKWCTDARAYFGLLVQRYPKSSLVKRAKSKGSALKKARRNKAKCKT